MLSTLTIAEASRRLLKKKISAVELLRSCIDRIEAVDETLQSVVCRNFDRALDEAKKTDDQGMISHPLSGIPYLAKDVYCEKGIPTTACSTILRSSTTSRKQRGAGKDYRPPFDATTTKRLSLSGAISIGKTNTDEFTMGSSTETSCYGTSRCPYDTSRVAGGSSGGSAAAVSGDLCLFATATDTGGSIRQPAAFCGITGMRVTYGRTSRFGTMSMASSLDTTGVLTKTVEDTAIILSAVAGEDPLDATTSNRPVPDYRSLLTGSVKGLTVGLPKEYFIKGLDPEIEEAVRAAARTLQTMGAKMKDISLPTTRYAIAAYYVICPCEVSSNMARYDGIRYGRGQKDPEDLFSSYLAVRSGGFGPEVKRRIMIGTYALSAGYFDAYYRQAQKVRTLIKRDFDEAFKEVDVILSPVTPSTAFPVGSHGSDPVAMYLEDAFTLPQALAGIPCLSIPCGYSVSGLPIGLQLAGPQWSEEMLLRVGYAYEKETEWRQKRKPAL